MMLGFGIQGVVISQVGNVENAVKPVKCNDQPKRRQCCPMMDGFGRWTAERGMVDNGWWQMADADYCS